MVAGGPTLTWSTDRAQIKQERMMSEATCKECGRVYDPWGKPTGYCSDACKAAAERRSNENWLRKEKEQGKKQIGKWAKQVDMLKRKIAKLEDAIASGNARAIYKARSGGFLRQVIRFMNFIFMLVGWGVVILFVATTALKAYVARHGGGQENAKPAAIEENAGEKTPATEKLSPQATEAKSDNAVTDEGAKDQQESPKVEQKQ